MAANEVTKAAHVDWENDLASLLGELTSVQSELLSVLEAKRERMGQNDVEGTAELRPRAEQLLDRLQSCHDRRESLLRTVANEGRPAATLGKLATRASRENRDKLTRQVKDTSRRMRLLQHQSIANWVLAQRTLLHVAQMLEIIATGGRLQPTYGSGESSMSGGALVDHQA
jgi:flagellar biosynthesis/type III secretory pathway chaperone